MMNRLTGNHMVVRYFSNPSPLYDIDVSTMTASFQANNLAEDGYLMTISQTDNDIVYVERRFTPFHIRKLQFNGVNNSISASLLPSTEVKSMLTIQSTQYMFVCEFNRIYLIDLDNFAAGAIPSTAVQGVASNGAYKERSISRDVLLEDQDAYLFVDYVVSTTGYYELFKVSNLAICYLPTYTHIVDGSCKAIVDFPDGYGLDSVTKKTKLCSTTHCSDCRNDYQVCLRCFAVQGYYLFTDNLCYTVQTMPDFHGLDSIASAVKPCAVNSCKRCSSD